MTQKTLILIASLVAITVVLFLIALAAPKDQAATGNTCELYGYMPLKDVPANCVQYFMEK